MPKLYFISTPPSSSKKIDSQNFDLQQKGEPPKNVTNTISDDEFFRQQKMKSIALFKTKHPNGAFFHNFKFLNTE